MQPGLQTVIVEKLFKLTLRGDSVEDHQVHLKSLIFTSHDMVIVFNQGGAIFNAITCKDFLPLSDIVDLRHQPNVMCITMLGERTHTRGLQRQKETPYKLLSQ